MEQRRVFPNTQGVVRPHVFHHALSRIKGRFTLRNGHQPLRLYSWRLIVYVLAMR